MKRLLLAATFLVALPAVAQTPGPFPNAGSTPPNTLFFNQLNSAFAGKQDFPGAIFSTSAIGHVPISPGGSAAFLRADGAWVPPQTINATSTPITGGVNGRPLFDNAGVIGEYTQAQLTAYLNTFTAGLQGLVPPSGGLPGGFLRADGIWISPANFSNLNPGYVPTSPGGTIFFLRADGSWSVPVTGVASLTVGTTSMLNGTSGRILFDNAGIVGERVPSGTGTTVVTTTGTQTSGNCVNIDANGNHVASGASCAGNAITALTSDVTATGPGSVAATIAANAVTNAKMATAAQNTVKGAATSTAIADLAVPSCSAASSALTWTTNTGFGCNSIAGSSANTQYFSSGGTWNKAAGTTFATIFVCGSGGGGGGGAQQASGSTASGGSGGGAGACVTTTVRVADIAASATITINAGGTAGVGATTTATAGGNGGNGGNVSFNDGANVIVTAGGGGGGQGGALGGNSTGGGSGGGSQSSIGITGGTAFGGVAGASGGVNNNFNGLNGGSGGGGTTIGATDTPGGNSLGGPTGGGSGGYITATPSAGLGGAAGLMPIGNQCNNATGGNLGVNGNQDTTNTATMPGCGGGGGGSQLGNTGAPGAGAAGIRGGGGGGGGSVCSSGGSCTARNGGAGGAGGTGFVWVYSW